MVITINHSKCKWNNGCSCNCVCSTSECKGCAEVCPTGAITRNKKVKIDQDKCINCGKCITACPVGAITRG